NPEHVVPDLADCRDVGGHARAQLEVRILDVDHRVVGDHVLGGDGGVSDLPHGSGEDLVGIGVDGEGGLHLVAQLTDVRLGDVGVDLHVGQVLGDGEQ